jgi:peptidoglycan/LPS O-acetylase OafA/YrhL
MGLYRPVNFGKEQFPALTGIRAMGAAAVFFVHLPFELGYKLVIDVMAFFFVLSGFLIVYLYYENVAVKAGKYKQYFVNRFARIYPVYFLLVTVAILLRHDFKPVFLFKNYTLTHALFYNQADRAIQQSWSVTTEECFYLLAPLIMYLIRKFNYAVAWFFGALLLGIALWISTLPVSFLHTANFVFSVTFFGHFFEFFCGIFLALLILRLKKNNSLALHGRKFTIAGCAGILICMGILVFSNNMNDPAQATQFILINNFILPIPVTVLYYGLIREKSVASVVLSSKLMGLLGRTSYTFYLLHVMIIEFIAVPFIEKHFVGYYNAYVLVVFILTQLLAFIIFAFYEEPLNMYIRKKLASHKL